MKNYYLHDNHTTTASGSSFFLPYGLTLPAVPTISDVICQTPGVSVEVITPTADGINIDVSPSVPAGTVFEWMVTTAGSVKSLFRSSMLEFSDLDAAGSVQGSDKSFLVRNGSPKSFAPAAGRDGSLTAGTAAIPEGAEEISVVYPTPLGSILSLSCTPIHASATPELITGVVTASSLAGFTYTLAAEAPSNASLAWEVIDGVSGGPSDGGSQYRWVTLVNGVALEVWSVLQGLWVRKEEWTEA